MESKPHLSLQNKPSPYSTIQYGSGLSEDPVPPLKSEKPVWKGRESSGRFGAIHLCSAVGSGGGGRGWWIWLIPKLHVASIEI